MDKITPLVGLFRTNQFVGNILLLAYAFLIRFPIFLQAEHPQEYADGGVLWDWLSTYSWAQPGTTGAVLATLLLCVQAVLLNVIENRFRLSGELNLIPGMVYLLFASAIPQSFYLSPLLIGMTFFILAIHEIIVCYKQYSPAIHIFNIGFWISMAFLCYESFWLFLIYAAISLSIIQSFRLKEFFMITSGFVVPLFLSGVLFFMNGQFDTLLENQFSKIVSWRNWMLGFSMENVLALSLFGIFLLIAILGHSSFLVKKGIHARKSIDVLYWSLPFAGISFLLQPAGSIIHLLLLAPGLAFVFTFILLRRSKPQAEAMHFLLLALILFWQFGPW